MLHLTCSFVTILKSSVSLKFSNTGEGHGPSDKHAHIDLASQFVHLNICRWTDIWFPKLWYGQLWGKRWLTCMPHTSNSVSVKALFHIMFESYHVSVLFSSVSNLSEEICLIISMWAHVTVMLFYCESHVNVNFTRLCLQWKIIYTSLVKSMIDKERIDFFSSPPPLSNRIFSVSSLSS